MQPASPPKPRTKRKSGAQDAGTSKRLAPGKDADAHTSKVCKTASRALGRHVPGPSGLAYVVSQLVSLFVQESHPSALISLMRATELIVEQLLRGTRAGAKDGDAQREEGQREEDEREEGKHREDQAEEDQAEEDQREEGQRGNDRDGEATGTMQGGGDAGGKHDDGDETDANAELEASGNGWFANPLLAVLRNDPGALRVAIGQAAQGGAPSHDRRAAVVLTLRWIFTLHADLAAVIDAAENDMRQATLAGVTYLTPWTTGARISLDADASGGAGGHGAASPRSSTSAARSGGASNGSCGGGTALDAVP